MNEFTGKTEVPSDIWKLDEPVQRAADSAASAARTVRSAASDLASSSTETLKAKASEFVDTAKTVASDAGARLNETVSEQRGAGADYANRLADSIDRAADQFGAEFPIAGSYMRSAASHVQSAAEALRTGNIDHLVKGAQSFAQRQPTAFLGLAFLAGFGVVRFVKGASSRTGSTADSRDHSDRNDYRRSDNEDAGASSQRREFP